MYAKILIIAGILLMLFGDAIGDAIARALGY